MLAAWRYRIPARTYDDGAIFRSGADVRHIHLTEKHSTNVKTSWYGESIGRYESDTLVVNTIGLDDRTSMGEFATPHTKQLHVIERFHLIDGGETLEVNVTIFNS